MIVALHIVADLVPATGADKPVVGSHFNLAQSKEQTNAET
jgi:hypothetical protein